MKKPLEERVESEKPKKEKNNLPKSLESIVSEIDAYSKIQEQKLNSKTPFYKKILNVGMLAGFWYLQLNFIPASLFYKSLIPLYGFIKSKKRSEKEKMTWNKGFRTAYLGQLMGYADVAIFSLPEYIVKLSPAIFSTGAAFSLLSGNYYLLKILTGTLTTLAFNPVMIPAYNIVYNALIYFRDRIGFSKTLFRINKLPKYLKHHYYTEIKGKWVQDTKNVFTNLFHLHWIQFNLHNNVVTRLLQSVWINNKRYADAMVKQKKGAKSLPKVGYADNYSDNKKIDEMPKFNYSDNYKNKIAS